MVFWGATPVLTRIATDDLDPLWVAVLRTVLAGVVAAPLVVTTERRPPSTARARLLLVVSAAAGFVIFPVVFTIGQERTSAMHGVGILAALPVFTGLYGMLVARRRPGEWWLAGCALALAGEAVIVAVRAGGGGAATLVGDLLVLASALVVSAGYVAGALLVPRGFSSAATTYWGVMLGAVALLPLALVLLAVQGLPRAGAASWAAVLFLAVVTSIAGYVGWYWALARGGISRIAPLQFLQPLSGLVVCLDPGHIGGEWAKMEERFFQVGDDPPVLEARLTLLACRRAADALEAAGATVLWTKTREEPVTNRRPDEMRAEALDILKDGSDRPLLIPPDLLEKKVRITAEKLFYRTEEIEARAAKIAAMKPAPQITLCVHFNAAPWGEPGHPRLVPQSRLVVFVHGQYSADEIDYEDERYGLVAKLLEQSAPLELAVAEKVAASVEAEWHILPEEYKDWPSVRRVGVHPYLYARNLLANRAFPGPVVFIEGPYMNADDFYPRLIAGDYEGTRLVAGKEQRSVFAEFGEAIARGVVDYVKSN